MYGARDLNLPQAAGLKPMLPVQCTVLLPLSYVLISKSYHFEETVIPDSLAACMRVNNSLPGSSDSEDKGNALMMLTWRKGDGGSVRLCSLSHLAYGLDSHCNVNC